MYIQFTDTTAKINYGNSTMLKIIFFIFSLIFIITKNVGNKNLKS